MSEDLTKIGKRIEPMLRFSGISRSDIGDILGVGQGAVGRYIRGEADAESVELNKTAKAYATPLNWLIFGEGLGPGEATDKADLQTMRAVIKAVEEHLQAEDKQLTPVKKAELITTLYEMFSEDR